MHSEQNQEEIMRLLTSHQQRLSGYIRSLIPSRADADDALQEVNLRIWRHREDYQPGTNFGAWAFQIAWNQVRTFRKRDARNPLRFDDALVEQLAGAAGPSADLGEPWMEALRLCLEKLSEKDRKLIGLRYEPGATTDSTAARVGRSLKGVYHALNRIRTALLECIQKNRTAEGQRP